MASLDRAGLFLVADEMFNDDEGVDDLFLGENEPDIVVVLLTALCARG